MRVVKASASPVSLCRPLIFAYPNEAPSEMRTRTTERPAQFEGTDEFGVFGCIYKVGVHPAAIIFSEDTDGHVYGLLAAKTGIGRIIKNDCLGKSFSFRVLVEVLQVRGSVGRERGSAGVSGRKNSGKRGRGETGASGSRTGGGR